jgi:hypothetical protein
MVRRTGPWFNDSMVLRVHCGGYRFLALSVRSLRLGSVTLCGKNNQCPPRSDGLVSVACLICDTPRSRGCCDMRQIHFFRGEHAKDAVMRSMWSGNREKFSTIRPKSNAGMLSEMRSHAVICGRIRGKKGEKSIHQQIERTLLTRSPRGPEPRSGFMHGRVQDREKVFSFDLLAALTNQ